MPFAIFFEYPLPPWCGDGNSPQARHAEALVRRWGWGQYGKSSKLLILEIRYVNLDIGTLPHLFHAHFQRRRFSSLAGRGA